MIPEKFPLPNEEEHPFNGKILGFLKKIPPHLRKLLITVIGGTLIVLGLALVVVPGPFTIPLLFAGFAVLSTEFFWAEKLFKKSKEGLEEIGKFIKHPLVLAFLLVVTVGVLAGTLKYGWWKNITLPF